jgi:ATP-binding cassette subfamily B protein
MILRSQISAAPLIWKLIRFSRWELLGDTLVSFIRFSAPLAVGIVQKDIFDLLSRNEPLHLDFWALLALTVGLAAVGLLSFLVHVWLFTRITFAGTALMRKNLLDHILRQPGAQSLAGSSSEAVSRFRDDIPLVTDAVWGTAVTIGQLGSGIIALAIMASIDTLIAFSVVLPLLAVIVITQILTGRLQAYRRASRSAAGAITGFLGEVFGAIQAVKVAGAERAVLTELDALNRERRRAAVLDRGFTQAVSAVYTNTSQLGTGLILFLGASAMRHGAFTVGDFALFVSYLAWISGVPYRIGLLLTRYKQAAVSFERMNQLLRAAPVWRVTQPTPIYLSGEYPAIPHRLKMPEDRLRELEVIKLTYLYPGTDRGVRGVDLRIRRGELVVITGRVGAGKSTLLRVLLGLLPRDAGTIRWNGIEVGEPSEFLVPPRVGYTAQVPRLFSESLRANVLLGLPEQAVDLQRALHTAMLGHDLAGMDAGLDTMIGPRGVKLSGGQVQRAAAARMFVRDAELLVVDDLSSALDIETEEQLWKQIREQLPVTVLAVSHRRSLITRADRVIVMKDGRVDAIGTWRELLSTCGEMQRLWQEN